jgi:hypothetical protein
VQRLWHFPRWLQIYEPQSERVEFGISGFRCGIFARLPCELDVSAEKPVVLLSIIANHLKSGERCPAIAPAAMEIGWRKSVTQLYPSAAMLSILQKSFSATPESARATP